MTHELVSIITPAYKAAKYIGEAIRSVQTQNHEHWEMLIVDDGSPDETADKVQEFSLKDPRIKLIRQVKSGAAAARQRALDAAHGPLIAFLDSDDYWLPSKLSKQIAFMRETGTAIGYTRFRRISIDGSTVGHLVRIPDTVDYRGLLCDTAIATSTVMVDRRITGPFRMTQAYYDDFVLWLMLLKHGFVARGLQEDLMRYRMVGESLSRNKLRSAREVWRTYRQIERLSIPDSLWCFSNYAVNSFRKHRRF